MFVTSFQFLHNRKKVKRCEGPEFLKDFFLSRSGSVLKSELRGNVLLHLFPLEDAMHSHWWPGKPRWTLPPALNPLTPPAAAKPWHRFDYFARKEDKRWFDHFAGTKQREEDLKLAKMSNYLQSSRAAEGKQEHGIFIWEDRISRMQLI